MSGASLPLQKPSYIYTDNIVNFLTLESWCYKPSLDSPSNHANMPPMGLKKSQFSNTDAWRSAAMQRESCVNAEESCQRARLADAHNNQEGMTNPDTLADQQLYIQGKMDKDEYQNYLLFKHAKA